MRFLSWQDSCFDRNLREKFEELFFWGRLVLVYGFIVTVPLWFFGFSVSSKLEWFFTLVAVGSLAAVFIVVASFGIVYVSYKEQKISMKWILSAMIAYGSFRSVLLLLELAGKSGLENIVMGVVFLVPAIGASAALRGLYPSHKIYDKVQERDLDEEHRPDAVKKYLIVASSSPFCIIPR